MQKQNFDKKKIYFYQSFGLCHTQLNENVTLCYEYLFICFTVYSEWVNMVE